MTDIRVTPNNIYYVKKKKQKPLRNYKKTVQKKN